VSTSRKTVASYVRAQHYSETSDLLARIALGDETAFRLFHDATNGLLFGLLLRILGDTRTAERALSELYDEIKLNAARFYRQKESPLTWLILIAHRRTIECLCSNHRADIEIQPINITRQRSEIRSAIESIPPSQRRMIELAFFSGMTNLEIALEMGETAEAVENGLRNGMLLLLAIFRSVYHSSASNSNSKGEQPMSVEALA
jgi:RNA polymerase sigma-70 factor, ECF subfamily